MGRDASAYPSCVLYTKHRLSILPLVGWVDSGLYVRCFLQAISSYGLIFHVSVHKPLKATEHMVVRENSKYVFTKPWTHVYSLCSRPHLPEQLFHISVALSFAHGQTPLIHGVPYPKLLLLLSLLKGRGSATYFMKLLLIPLRSKLVLLCADTKTISSHVLLLFIL